MITAKNKIYFYKLTADNGGAPCLDKEGKVLSLAICKPMIRSTARPGDLIFGFAANSLDQNNRLIYIAYITEKKGADYYTNENYMHRDDCIYELKGDRFVWRKKSRHHSQDDVDHDLGKYPLYPKARVLLSSDFRYFGVNGESSYKTQYPLIKNAIEQLGVGHRVNHGEQLRSQFRALQQQKWKETQQQVLGDPTSIPQASVIHRCKSYGVIDCGSC